MGVGDAGAYQRDKGKGQGSSRPRQNKARDCPTKTIVLSHLVGPKPFNPKYAFLNPNAYFQGSYPERIHGGVLGQRRDSFSLLLLRSIINLTYKSSLLRIHRLL